VGSHHEQHYRQRRIERTNLGEFVDFDTLVMACFGASKACVNAQRYRVVEHATVMPIPLR
jgi:hypothetical protein